MNNRFTDSSGLEEVPSELALALRKVPKYQAEPPPQTSKEEDPRRPASTGNTPGN